MTLCSYTCICVPAHLIVDMGMYLTRLLSTHDEPREYAATQYKDHI